MDPLIYILVCVFVFVFFACVNVTAYGCIIKVSSVHLSSDDAVSIEF